ncbi:hypothetical protein BRADI_5g26755v3 [Brachypodium distachyon]|uniref:Uncharacterized protein n=1 Tax=Brachypodium distachyon TaxID=15368 RepID=A0A2K2CJG7_BRADI|nr:hypothetical protein BRADI_5g26755v3 [Brachypodium distachyon]
MRLSVPSSESVSALSARTFSSRRRTAADRRLLVEAGGGATLTKASSRKRLLAPASPGELSAPACRSPGGAKSSRSSSAASFSSQGRTAADRLTLVDAGETRPRAASTKMSSRKRHLAPASPGALSAPACRSPGGAKSSRSSSAAAFSSQSKAAADRRTLVDAGETRARAASTKMSSRKRHLARTWAAMMTPNPVLGAWALQPRKHSPPLEAAEEKELCRPIEAQLGRSSRPMAIPMTRFFLAVRSSSDSPPLAPEEEA